MKRIEHIQSLRAAAAGLVVISHALEYMVRRQALTEQFHQLAYLTGWLGVTSFFVISGLIMVRSSWTEFGAPRATAAFAVRRLTRVVPLYWLATLAFAVRHVLQGHDLLLDELLKSLLFIPYLSDGSTAMRPLAGQGWTLNYEMGFYALFALSMSLPRYAGIMAVLLALSGLTLGGLVVRPLIPYQDASNLLQFWTDPIILWFGVGVALGVAEQCSIGRHAIGRPFAISLLLLIVTLAVSMFARVSFPLQIWWQGAMGLVCAITVSLCASADNAAPSPRWLQRAGDASYSVYLFHPLILTVLAAAWNQIPPGSRFKTPLLFITISVIACGLAGRWVFVFVERPLTSWLQNRSRASPHPVTRANIAEQ